MLTKRIISLAVALSLLFAICQPVAAADAGCGAAARAERTTETALAGGHCCCHSCERSCALTADEDATERPVATTVGSSSYRQQSLCCHDGSDAKTRVIDGAVIPGKHAPIKPMVSQNASDYLTLPGRQCIFDSILNHPRPESSPPPLADLARHTYRRNSVFLI